jgi:oligopeptide/dipeptide ABC transporter ATP-binding protein
MSTNKPLIKTIDLIKYFNTPNGLLHAVDGINLSIEKGETLGIVGESGCGKSTLGRTILRLIEPTSGQILYDGEDICRLNDRQMKEMRKKMQIIFQDPYASLNPRLSVGELIAEPMKVTKMFDSRKQLDERIFQLMEIVGIDDRFVNSYPHELDGGRRQRIGIARALSLNPEFIVCDEPVSSLDVSIQAQILNLMMDLQEKMGLTYMFITHDLSVVKHISNKIAVLYLGQCVEYASSEELFNNPIHPYTKALLSAIPIPNIKNRNKKRELIQGEITSPIEPKPGCRFAARCKFACEKCVGKEVPLSKFSDEHFVACVMA